MPKSKFHIHVPGVIRWGQVYPVCIHCGRAMKDAPKVYTEYVPENNFASISTKIIDSMVVK